MEWNATVACQLSNSLNGILMFARTVLVKREFSFFLCFDDLKAEVGDLGPFSEMLGIEIVMRGLSIFLLGFS